MVDNEMPRGGAMWALVIGCLILVAIAQVINFFSSLFPRRKKQTRT